jgi:transposase
MDLSGETRVEVLRTTAISLHEEVVRLRRELDAYRKAEAKSSQQALALQDRIHRAEKALYGDSSERRGFTLKAPKRDHSPQPGHGPTEQTELRLEEETLELDDADKTCPKCGDSLQEWKDQFELSELIDVVVEQFVLKKLRRQKYRCECGHIDTALGAPKLVRNGRYSIGFAIDAAVKKYADHIPLARQETIARRAGLKVTTSALWDQLDALARHLEPLRDRLLAHLHTKDVLGADETSWRLLNKRSPKRHYVWGLCGDDAVLYHIVGTRGADGARPLLHGYTGRVMADDYSVYQALEKSKDMAFVLDGCWAHVRRKFIDAESNEPIRAPAVVALIGELYRTEKMAVGPPGSDEHRRSLEDLRENRSRSVVEALRVWAFEVHDPLPESSFGKALAYMRSCFPRLTAFLEDGRIALDNNATERALRGIVVGRKNHYGSKSKRGTEVASLLYSLVESAKLVGLCPRAYLRAAIDAAIAGDDIPLPHQLQR